MPLPLHDIRVVDFSRVLAGPHCVKTLLDLGAEVIKIEPPAGDLSRRAFPNADGISGYYAQQNAGKRNLSIDLNVPGACDAIARLCDTADVIVGSMSFPFYLAAMRRPDLGRDSRFLTPELRLRNLAALHRIVQEWIWTFADMDSLDAQLDEAKIATGQVRSLREFADSDWAREWRAVRTVSDRSGGEIKIPGRPWHFADQVVTDECQLPARQGEHNTCVLAELGLTPAELAALKDSGALVQHEQRTEAAAAG